MYPAPGNCPVCSDPLTLTELHCRSCDTTLRGQFTFGRFSRLSPAQLDFMELFVRSEGKINRVCQELDLSYPVVRARLTDLIESLGYSVGEAAPELLPEETRREILAQVAAGQISAETAARLLRNA
jgi:hypothetical protein